MSKFKDLISMLKRRTLYAFGITTLLIALVGGVQIPQTSAQSWSFVRIFHASPNAGIVDVFMDGSKILSNFQYGTLTGYTTVAAGVVNVSTNGKTLVSNLPYEQASIFVIDPVKDGNASTTHFQFVQAQITGTPGMPRTGSDPRALPTSVPSQPFVSWPWMLLIVLLFGLSIPKLLIRQVRAKQPNSAN